ncbi:MAG: FtsQ-type POTRA domain-containing protein [Clostridia bacterium]|nr:FtsQ-type POTRA domain-containing protein [Clostridia bacterium]
MNDNNEYYAEKMRRLLENKESRESIKLDDSRKTASQNISGLPEEIEEDFSFDEKSERERPKNYEEKRAQVKEAEAQARAESKNRKYSKKEMTISACLVIATIILAIFCVYNIFFVVRSISVEGNERYTTEQILASANINVGDRLYSFSSRIAEEDIKMYCPNVKDIKVKRTPPGKIVVTVEEEEAYYYADFYGEIRAMTKDLRVLGGISEAEASDLIKIKMPEVSRAVAGETVVFKEGECKYVYEVALAAAESALVNRLGTVDLRNQNDVSVTCDGKYILKFKEYKDSAAKLKIASKVLEDELFNNDNKATIDLSELSSTGVVIDNQLEVD